MQVGDLVRSKKILWQGYVGIIIREIPGTDQRKVVQWVVGERTCTPARNLEVISEARVSSCNIAG